MLEGKVCVVTGAGGGLGREFALALAAAGASVVVNDTGASLSGEGADNGPASAVVEEIRAAGGRAVANGDSVASWDSAQRIIATAIEEFGRLDLVVNNAGILRDRIFHKMEPEQWRAVIDVHLHGSFYVSRAAAPVFMEQGSGSYVHITSTTGLIGNFGQANYAAAKLGIAALSKSIALDMHRLGVRSNCIAPFAWTRMIDSIPANTPEELERVKTLQIMEGAKVAPLVVYLGSDAAAEVTGQIFAVRANEISLMGQSRPIRGMVDVNGWTACSIRDRAIPALQPHFYGLDRTSDVFSWDPV
jgi:NAD(P)-dependent dehydrogenase (short-subunit alcohol dehydrogenase family)